MTPAETRGPAREQAIREAALELLVEVGYDRLTIDAVATRAHASKATIYRRWDGKGELVRDALQCRVAAPATPPDSGSLRADLLTMLAAIPVTTDARDSLLLLGLLRAGHEAPDLRDCVVRQVIDEKRHVIDTIVARARARGEAVRPDAADVVHELLAPLIFFRMAVEGLPVDEPFVRHVVDDVVLPLLTLVPAPSPACAAPSLVAGS